MRDSAVWKVPEGIAVRWVNMGEGNVDIDGWIRKFIQAKPGMPIIFENLVSGAPRVHHIYDQAFWENWRKMTGGRLQPLPDGRRTRHADAGRRRSRRARRPGSSTSDDLEVCVRYTRALLERL